VSIKGKVVRPEQTSQVLSKVVTPDVTPKAALKLVMLFAPLQAFARLIPKSMSVVRISVIRSSSPLSKKYG